ncbi:MAG: transporter permease [Caballeronia sp.]|jgi:multiple sugar transport system permease protein|uniref:carbohydrate ABC transporter permease n=1 Tax=Caballeronia sp. TaxID=1931223 RepID=UPI00262DE0C9|nr:carbohydrate ABC transporter permease [Caballeronia sp.]MDB5835505.1 transporter permease [Caballeronia sp.]MEA3095226.1 multiple sugar transport system permease protein [Caballeronia sp.]MEA3116056.1 multiple sugar transport system permease protein [Caballeronia sp.]
MSTLPIRFFTPAGRRSRRTAFLALAGIAIAIYILAPFCWLLLTSFMHERDALTVPTQWIPLHPTLEHYRTFFHPSGANALVGGRAAEEMLPGMVNSLLAALGTAVANLVLGTLAGYSLARLRFRGQNALLGVYLGSRMVPGIALIVPLYLTLKNLGMLDHLSALITTYVTFTLPFTIWLLKNYFQTIPRSLEEAAFMDGCSWLQMLVKVLLPVAMPGLVSAAMFAFMTAWNDYLFAVILTSTTASKTLPVVVAGFATDVTTQRTLMATGGVLAIIPPLALAFLFQRLIVQGLTSGAVKD